MLYIGASASCPTYVSIHSTLHVADGIGRGPRVGSALFPSPKQGPLIVHTGIVFCILLQDIPSECRLGILETVS